MILSSKDAGPMFGASSEGSPASLFRWREPAKGNVISVGSGKRFAMSSINGNRSTSWLKTCRDSLVQGMLPGLAEGSLETFSGTWPDWGSMQNGVCYRQQHLVLRISGKECSLLPTPTATEYGSNQGGAAGREGQKNRPSLGTLARTGLLPTPAARDHRSPNKKSYQERSQSKKGEQLPNAVGGLLNPEFVETMMGFPLGWTELPQPSNQGSDDETDQQG